MSKKYRTQSNAISPADLLATYLARAPGAELAMQRSADIPCMMLSYQAAALFWLASQYNRFGAAILEIGTLAGYSASIMAQAAPLAHIVTLNSAEAQIETARHNLASWQVDVRLAVSWEELALYQGRKLGMIFVDGDHRRVALDVPWFNWLRVGGLILFHDFTPAGSQPVVDAINGMAEYLSREPDIVIRDTDGIGMAGFYRERGENIEALESKWIS